MEIYQDCQDLPWRKRGKRGYTGVIMRHACNHGPPFEVRLVSTTSAHRGPLGSRRFTPNYQVFHSDEQHLMGKNTLGANLFLKTFPSDTEKKKKKKHRKVINLYYICLLPLCFPALFLQVWQSCYSPLLPSLPPLLSNLVLGFAVHKHRVLLVFLGGI